MSEGQNAVLYLGSVTVQERRIESDARTIEKIVEAGEKSGQINKTELLAALKEAKETANTGKEELEKLQVPNATKDIHGLFQQLFNLNIKQLSLAEMIVNTDNAEEKSKLQQEFTTIKQQIAEISQKVLDEKRRLSEKYQEVQLPEASPSTEATK